MQCGRPGLIPGLGRSPGEGQGNPLQYSGLENSTDCIVHGVTKSQTQRSNFLFLLGHLFEICLVCFFEEGLYLPSKNFSLHLIDFVWLYFHRCLS